MSGGKYKPKKRGYDGLGYGLVYGKIGAGAITRQLGGVATDYVYPVLVKDYLKKQK